MRGKEDYRTDDLEEPGITPARAGKRTSCLYRYRLRWDHPRACGEKVWIKTNIQNIQGSPPRVRGKGTVITRKLGIAGITPARAGKRCTIMNKNVVKWDHPRACGEKRFAQLLLVLGGGSPPRVRGKALRPPPRHPGAGITPARAGKRSAGDGRGTGIWDHPRACGEKGRGDMESPSRLGSPPRVRGKGRRPRGKRRRRGITPARAGKSMSFLSSAPGVGDHPRACGEKILTRTI